MNSMSVQCAHCGLPCDTSISDNDFFEVASEDKQEFFCCIGCRTVYHVIKSTGLGDYYRVRDTLSQPGMKPKEVVTIVGAHLDDPLFLAQYSKPLVGRKIIVRFFIPEVYCGACVWLLERLPVCDPGVVSSELRLVTKQLAVIIDLDRTSVSNVAQCISRFGYTFHVLDKDQVSNPAYKNEDLSRLAVAVFCAMNCMMIAVSLYQGWWTGIDESMKFFLELVSAVLALPTITYSAKPIIFKAIAGLRMKKITLDFPLSFGVVTGYILSLFSTLFGLGEVYYDSIAVLIALLLIARYANTYTLEKFKRQGNMLTSVFPQSAQMYDSVSESIRDVYVKRLVPGDVCVLTPTCTVPADGEVLGGSVYLDCSIVSGEAEPIKVTAGGTVWAGTIVIEGNAKIRITRTQESSRFYQSVFSLIGNAELGSELSKQIDRRSLYFVLWILIISFISFSYHYSVSSFKAGFEALLAILVISCPCALGISIPFTYTSACIKAAKKGIYFGSGAVIEKLARTQKMIFDKTGTLTQGTFSHINEEYFLDLSIYAEVLSKMYAIENHQPHPIAKAISSYVSTRVSQITSFEIIERDDSPGRWVGARFRDGSSMYLGNISVLEKCSISSVPDTGVSVAPEVSLVYVVYNNTIASLITLSDAIRPDIASLVSFFRKNLIPSYILSGDRKEVVNKTAQLIGIEEAHSFFNLTPEEKELRVKMLGEGTVMVGDGINDVRALKAADVGISVTGGISLLQKAGGISIIDFSAQKLLSAYVGARSTIRAARYSVMFSTIYNIFATILAACGLISPLVAAILMPVSSITVIVMAAKLPRFDYTLIDS